uniref:MIT, microtubule interacting and transport, domain containing 1 n=1 Tax=Cyprinus carpio TaxID=7962 RepID=A0A8C1JQP1_CYPCA
MYSQVQVKTNPVCQEFGNGKLLMELEGSLNMITVFLAVKDDSKKVHYREKIKGYMDQVEQIKDHVNKLKEGWLKIADSSTGFSYESLLKPYIRDGLTEVWVQDPYVRHLYNFLRFCEMLLKCQCKVKTIHLLTSQDEVSSAQQTSALAEIKQSLQSQNVCLDVQYSSTIHDREIRFNNGWIIKIRYCDYDLRECHETTVDIFHTKHTKKT